MNVQAVYDPLLRYDTFIALGWYNILWLVGIVAVALAARAGKIGFRVVGRNERGARELFGFPVWKVFRGAHFFIAGILDVRKVPVVPIALDISQRIHGPDRKIMGYRGTIFVEVDKKWKALKKAIYNTFDPDKKDLENEARDKQTKVIASGAIRRILTGQESVDVLTKEALVRECGGDLWNEYGNFIVRIVNEEYTPVDMQIVANAIEKSEGEVALLPAVIHDEGTGDGPPNLSLVPSS